MEAVERAIKDITKASKRFPQKEFEILLSDPDGARPYLRSAVERAIREKEDIEEDYQLHFYAIFLLAQMRDRDLFPKLIELVSLPEDTLDYLIGDAVTENVRDILYNTYNGDLDLLIKAVRDPQAGEFARASMLDVLGQLYLDKTISKEGWQQLLSGIAHGDEDADSYIYTAVAEMICDCHFIEMLPEIRWLYENERVDESAIGGYDDCIDMLFGYDRGEHRFCKPAVDAIETLKGWAMFEQPQGGQKDRLSVKNDPDPWEGSLFDPAKKAAPKIGRNDPCPCGSGRKYKQCCLGKPKDTVQTIESAEERAWCLSSYPKARTGEEDRIFLEDFYDSESIEIDKLLYLALKHRITPIWRRESKETIDQRRRVYLIAAFRRFMAYIEKEGIQSFAGYDARCSIHYTCEEWISVLRGLLEEKDDDGLLDTLSALSDRMAAREQP